MKTTSQLFCTLLMCVFMNVNVFAQDKEVPGKELTGNWAYTFEHPMEGTIKGVCEIVMKDKAVTATFKQGEEAGNKTTAFRWNENGKYYADMDAQGYAVTVSFKPNGNTMKCEMDAGVMVIPVEMEKMN